MNSPNGDWGESERSEAQRLAEEALLYRPGDAAANDMAARLFLLLDDVDRAFEYSARAVKLEPDTSGFRRTHSAVHHERGNRGHAIAELEKALELNSSDVEARKMLDSMRMKPRRNWANGG
jgi:tetratricopeptide (TPR) repeat protein